MDSYYIIGDQKDTEQKVSILLHTLGIHKNDVMYIVPSDTGSIGIDAVREIRSFLYSQPLHGQLHAVCVSHADVMTIQAQNALLKILEEPPISSRIFLETTSPERMLETITSRCECINVTTPHVDTVVMDRFDILYETPKKIGTWMSTIDTEVASRDEAMTLIDAAISDATRRLQNATTDDDRFAIAIHLTRMADAKHALRSNAPFKLCLDSLLVHQ